MKPRALDLFCGAGGVSMGLHRAGFDVVGVDIRPQPNYPFPFIRGDVTALDPRGFDFIWASPPCQDASIGAARWKAAGKKYPKLIEPTREKLEASGCRYVIENVVGAAIRPDLVLVGPMFGLKTWRRRHFEISGFFALQPPLPPRQGPKTTPGFVTVAGNGGHGPNRIGAFREALGIEWMTKPELREAIPPAYAQFIGEAALCHIERIAA